MVSLVHNVNKLLWRTTHTLSDLSNKRRIIQSPINGWSLKAGAMASIQKHTRHKQYWVSFFVNVYYTIEEVPPKIPFNQVLAKIHC